MKISLLMCTFNSEDVVIPSLTSLIGQSYSNWELIVQDCLSTDRTIENIRAFNDARIKIRSQADKGIYDALNKAAKRANGEILGLLHSGDLLTNNRVIEHVVNQFAKHKFGIDVYYGDILITNGDGSIKRRWISNQFTEKNLRYGWMPPHTSIFFSKYAWELIGKFDDNYKISADYDWCIRLFKCNRLEKKYVPGYVVTMPSGGASNGSLKKEIQKFTEDFRVIKKNGLPFYSLIFKKIRKLAQFL